jgi:hypothetical protein
VTVAEDELVIVEISRSSPKGMHSLVADWTDRVGVSETWQDLARNLHI